MQTVYEAAGGRDGLLRLASAWHTRVLEDEVVSHAFSHGHHPQHTERLATYWAEALGGPTTYSDPMSRYHHSAEDVPDGLHIPKWSWHGLVSGAATDDA